MSTLTIPQTDSRRKARARQIAATVGSIYELNPDHYLVQSQTTASTHYVVERETRATWTCTCPDYQRPPRGRHLCKHILAVWEIQSARTEALAWARSRGIATADLVTMLEDRIAEAGLDLDTREQLQRYHNALTIPTIVMALRYWWSDYRPDAILDDMDSITCQRPDPLEIRWGGRPEDWRPTAASLEQIRDYMFEHNLQPGPVLIEPFSASRRQGRAWQGLYRVHIIRETAA